MCAHVCVSVCLRVLCVGLCVCVLACVCVCVCVCVQTHASNIHAVVQKIPEECVSVPEAGVTGSNSNVGANNQTQVI